MRALSSLFLFAFLVAQPLAAQESMDEVVITGEYPGPGLWKVTRPDHDHVLWIVGDPWALPKRLQWKSREIEATVAASQEILQDVAVTVTSDEKVGLLRGITLVPALLKARKNPDDARLDELLPPGLYARWLTQKKLYLGRESGVERWRPLFAADKLRRAAFDDLALRERGTVWEVVGKLAAKRKIRITAPTLTFTFKRAELREKIREFSKESLADLECFATTLDLTEALARRDVENRRAHAWATGDLATLAALPELPSPYLPCIMAVMNAQVAREIVPADIRERVNSRWLEAADAAFAANASTFAVVPMSRLTQPEGYVKLLRDRGYVVEEPR